MGPILDIDAEDATSNANNNVNFRYVRLGRIAVNIVATRTEGHKPLATYL